MANSMLAGPKEGIRRSEREGMEMEGEGMEMEREGMENTI